MDIITSVKGWVGKLAELGVSLLALTIVAELLGLGAVPFELDEAGGRAVAREAGWRDGHGSSHTRRQQHRCRGGQ